MRQKHRKHLAQIGEEAKGLDRLCELNVIEQVANVCQTTITRDAWERGQALAVHGWIYGLNDGLLRDMEITASGLQEAETAYQAAVSTLI